jgi:hypothetical protein
MIVSAPPCGACPGVVAGSAANHCCALHPRRENRPTLSGSQFAFTPFHFPLSLCSCKDSTSLPVLLLDYSVLHRASFSAMSWECALWNDIVIAAENSKNSTRRQILGLSSRSLALSPPLRANVPLPTRHFLIFQSSHPAIEIPPISLKTIIEKFPNRHTFALFFASDRSAHCEAQLLASLPLCLFASEFPFWPGSPKPQGEGGYSTHPGGSIPPNFMKTLIEKFSARHTSLKGASAGTLKEIQEGEEKALAAGDLAEESNRNTRPLKNR